MEFKISNHAVEEMRRRAIGRDVVVRVLMNPEQIIPGKEGRKVYQSRVSFGDEKMYLVRVIVADDNVPPVVVTVYRTSRLAKYWRLS